MKGRVVFSMMVLLWLTIGVVGAAGHVATYSAWRIYVGISNARALVAEGDTIWAATDGDVLRWNRVHETYRRYTTDDGLASNEVTAIAIEEAGHVWFGTWGGISEFDGQTWTTYTHVDGLARDRVYAVAIDPQGHKWFGTEGYPAAMAAFDGLLGVAESRRSREAVLRALPLSRLFDFTESVFDTVLEIVGRLVRAEGRRLVVEFESPSDPFLLGAATEVEVVFEGLTLSGIVAADASTRPGVCAEGTTVRLVLDVTGDLPVGKSPRFVTVEMEGSAGLLIRIEVPTP